MAIQNNSDLKLYFKTGSHPTEAEFGDLIDSLSLPYGCYTAILNQTGTDDPGATTIINTIGMDFLWERSDVGKYSCRVPRGIDISRLFVSLRDRTELRSDISIQFTTNRVTLISIVCSGDEQLSNTLIEIQYYNDERIIATKMDEDLARYFQYFKKEELTRDENLYLSPSSIYIPASQKNEKIDVIEENTEEHAEKDVRTSLEDLQTSASESKKGSLELFKLLTDRYIILPEIWDDQKNPDAYNLDTNRFCNFYEIKGGSNFIKNSVKKSIKSDAEECVLFVGKDEKLTNNNIVLFERAVNSKNNQNIKNINVITETEEGMQVNEYTLQDFKIKTRPTPKPPKQNE